MKRGPKRKHHQRNYTERDVINVATTLHNRGEFVNNLSIGRELIKLERFKGGTSAIMDAVENQTFTRILKNNGWGMQSRSEYERTPFIPRL